MLSDPTFLWGRVADIAFNRKNKAVYSSPYCVKSSTGQPTSLSGGLKNGTLGPQTPPAGAKSNSNASLIDGTSTKNSTGSSLAVSSIQSGATSAGSLVSRFFSTVLPVFITLVATMIVL